MKVEHRVTKSFINKTIFDKKVKQARLEDTFIENLTVN